MLFISEKHILWIHFGENFIDIWGEADFGPYSSQSFLTNVKLFHVYIKVHNTTNDIGHKRVSNSSQRIDKFR
jgi:hypothetical protein